MLFALLAHIHISTNERRVMWSISASLPLVLFLALAIPSQSFHSTSTTNVVSHHRTSSFLVQPINQKRVRTRGNRKEITKLSSTLPLATKTRTRQSLQLIQHISQVVQTFTIRNKQSAQNLFRILSKALPVQRKYAIYVLECENDKYYVGCTQNIQRRIKEHMSNRGGSSWTRIHKPLRVQKVYRRIPSAYYLGKEAQVTAELMLAHGINNVRGAMFAETREYSMNDIGALTGFLGHYNEISYKQLSFRLKEQLSDSKDIELFPRRRGVRRNRKRDKCFNCGEQGHWSNECPQSWKGLSRNSYRCYKCGQKGHLSKDCSETD